MTAGIQFNLVFVLLLLLQQSDDLRAQVTADTSAINQSTKEAYSIARKNPDVSVLISRQALAASETISYKKGMADASLALGMAYLAKYNQGDSAQYYNQRALVIYEETGEFAGQGRANYGLAYVYSFRSDFVTSEKYGQQALDCFEKAGDYRGIINSLNVLAYLARQEQDLEKASRYIERAIAAAREDNKTVILKDLR